MFVSKEAYREAIQRLLDHNEHQEKRIERLVEATSAVLLQLKFAHRVGCEKVTIKDVKALRLACTDVLAAIKEAMNGS